MKQLGERIRAERIAQGYSLKSAAEQSGIARDTWRKIEEGGSVQDTKRYAAMAFLGISESNTEWGTVGKLEDHAANPAGLIDLNVMFSQAVRFAATVALIVPEVREEAEQVSLSLSHLYTRGLDLWDRVPPMDREEGDSGDSGSSPALIKAEPELPEQAGAQVEEGFGSDQPRRSDYAKAADDTPDIETEQEADESP